MNTLKKLFVALAIVSLCTFTSIKDASAATVLPSLDLHIYQSGAIGVVDNSLLVGYDAPNGQSIPYLKFDVSSLRNQFSSVSSAKLVLTGSSFPMTSNIDVFKTADNWNAQTISWNNKPQVQGLLGSFQVPFSFAQQKLSWNLDAGQIASDIFNPNDGFLSLELQVSNPFSTAIFASSETMDSPMLLVDGAPVPEPTTAILGLLGIGGLMRLRRK